MSLYFLLSRFTFFVAFYFELRIILLCIVLLHIFFVALRALSLGLNDFKAVKYLLQAVLDKIFNSFKIFQFFQN